MNLWEERLQALAKAARIDLDRLPARKSDPGKVRLAAAMKLASSVANGWLATRLAMGRPASASQFVRRWQADEPRRAATAALFVELAGDIGAKRQPSPAPASNRTGGFPAYAGTGIVPHPAFRGRSPFGYRLPGAYDGRVKS